MSTNKRKNSDDDSDNEEYDVYESGTGSNASQSHQDCNSSEAMNEVEDKPSGDTEKSEKANSTVMDALLENSESHKLEAFPCQVPGCLQFFDTLIDYDTHYNMKHRHACATCKKTLLTPHFLELHVLESHDTLFELMAQRRPMFQCYVESCKEKFLTSKERHTHGVAAHGYPKNFMYSQNPNKIHWQQPKGSKSAHKNRSSSSKDRKTSKSSCENSKMELDETASGKEVDTGKSVKEKAPHMHISFGHKTTKVFSRKHKFGMKPERKDQPTTTSLSEMDLEDLKMAIDETAKVENENVELPS